MLSIAILTFYLKPFSIRFVITAMHTTACVGNEILKEMTKW
jgi:hypothetical protein